MDCVVITVRRHYMYIVDGCTLSAQTIDLGMDVSEFLFHALAAVPLRKAPAPIQQETYCF